MSGRAYTGARPAEDEEGLLRPVCEEGERASQSADVLLDAFHQREVLRETEHRPWPLPSEPWLMGQVWQELLFAHWRVDREALRRVVPPQLPLDRFDGSAWLGVSPFLVRGARLRGLPPPPVLSAFPEINVRTYVTVGGRPGIYFLSLDADSRAAVFAARRAYRLPYFRSQISVSKGARGEIAWRSERTSRDGPAAAFEAVYRAVGPPRPASPGSLEHFLAERYCLYTLDDRQGVQRAEIHHPPWPLQAAEAEVRRNTMTAPHGIGLEGEPILHFAAREDVALWPIKLATGT